MQSLCLCDVSKEQDWVKLVESRVRKIWQGGFAVNNAGIAHAMTLYNQLTEDTMLVNLNVM